jgi:hypothetical protein
LEVNWRMRKGAEAGQEAFTRNQLSWK